MRIFSRTIPKPWPRNPNPFPAPAAAPRGADESQDGRRGWEAPRDGQDPEATDQAPARQEALVHALGESP